MFKIGDLVTRNSYQNDIVFKIIRIEDNTYYLKGTSVRLFADCNEIDLKKYDGVIDKEEQEFLDRIKPDVLERNDYFYLPGKILHIDSDQEYLNRCLKYYENINIWAVGILEKEENIASKIQDLLEEYNPNIVVITGHDAYYRKKGDISNLDNYKYSKYYVNT